MAKPPTYEYYDYDDLCLYAGIDTEVTLNLLAKLMPQIRTSPEYFKSIKGTIIRSNATSIWRELLDVKQLALEFTCNLKITGMQYDIPANARMAVIMEKDLEDTRLRINAAVGRDVPLSGDGFSKFLFRDMRLVSDVKTDGGDDATSGEALKHLYEKYGHEWLLDIKRYVEVRAMYNGFINDYVDKFVKKDGRIHCDYNLQGTSSHRISSTNPNMLNMPRPSRAYPLYNIRTLYTATEGHSLLAFDFSSCEVKILAALSGDKNMIYACEQGYDFHTFTASMIEGVGYIEFHAMVEDESHPRHKWAKERRQFAKAVTFGLLYGSSVAGIAATLNVTIPEAEAIIAGYFDRFPDVKVYIDDCHAMARMNHYMVTPFGQRKQEHGSRDVFRGTSVYNASFRNAQNVSIQSPASTVGLICFAMLDRDLRRRGIGRAVLTVYDSVEFEVLHGHEAEAAELAYYYLDDWPVDNFDWLTFKIGCDGEIGFNFGELHKIHRGVTQEDIEELLNAA
jgi:DNA polymerase-1